MPMLTKVCENKINDATKDSEDASQTSYNSRKKHIKIQENVATVSKRLDFAALLEQLQLEYTHTDTNRRIISF